MRRLDEYRLRLLGVAILAVATVALVAAGRAGASVEFDASAAALVVAVTALLLAVAIAGMTLSVMQMASATRELGAQTRRLIDGPDADGADAARARAGDPRGEELRADVVLSDYEHLLTVGTLVPGALTVENRGRAAASDVRLFWRNGSRYACQELGALPPGVVKEVQIGRWNDVQGGILEHLPEVSLDTLVVVLESGGADLVADEEPVWAVSADGIMERRPAWARLLHERLAEA